MKIRLNGLVLLLSVGFNLLSCKSIGKRSVRSQVKSTGEVALNDCTSDFGSVECKIRQLDTCYLEVAALNFTKTDFIKAAQLNIIQQSSSAMHSILLDSAQTSTTNLANSASYNQDLDTLIAKCDDIKQYVRSSSMMNTIITDGSCTNTSADIESELNTCASSTRLTDHSTANTLAEVCSSSSGGEEDLAFFKHQFRTQLHYAYALITNINLSNSLKNSSSVANIGNTMRNEPFPLSPCDGLSNAIRDDYKEIDGATVNEHLQGVYNNVIAQIGQEIFVPTSLFPAIKSSLSNFSGEELRASFADYAHHVCGKGKSALQTWHDKIEENLRTSLMVDPVARVLVAANLTIDNRDPKQIIPQPVCHEFSQTERREAQEYNTRFWNIGDQMEPIDLVSMMIGMIPVPYIADALSIGIDYAAARRREQQACMNAEFAKTIQNLPENTAGIDRAVRLERICNGRHYEGVMVVGSSLLLPLGMKFGSTMFAKEAVEVAMETSAKPSVLSGVRDSFPAFKRGLESLVGGTPDLNKTLDEPIETSITNLGIEQKLRDIGVNFDRFLKAAREALLARKTGLTGTDVEQLLVESPSLKGVVDESLDVSDQTPGEARRRLLNKIFGDFDVPEDDQNTVKRVCQAVD